MRARLAAIGVLVADVVDEAERAAVVPADIVLPQGPQPVEDSGRVSASSGETMAGWGGSRGMITADPMSKG